MKSDHMTRDEVAAAFATIRDAWPIKESTSARAARSQRFEATQQAIVLHATDFVFALAIARAKHLIGIVSEDLVGAGIEAVYWTMRDFDPDQGYTFLTFARPRVRLRINQEVTTVQRPIRLANNFAQYVVAYDAAFARLENELGRKPEPIEVGRSLGWGHKRVTSHLAQVRMTASEIDPQWLTSRPGPAHEQTSKALARILRYVPNTRNRKLVASYAGLTTEGEKTLSQVGKEFGVTEERVRQIHGKVIGKLSRLAAAGKFDDFAPDGY